MGRPSKYTRKVADEICRRLAEGESLRGICGDGHLPHRESVRRWLRDNEEFRRQYARAREDQADAIFEEMLEIADDARNDWMERKARTAKGVATDGAPVLNVEAITRSRLRVETRKWMIAKLAPKKYGERVEVDHQPGGSLEEFLRELVQGGNKEAS